MGHSKSAFVEGFFGGMGGGGEGALKTKTNRGRGA